jgi:hypothetical protein
LSSALFPAVILALVTLGFAHRFRARRRAAKLAVSGGRKAFVLNLAERGR